MVVGEVLEMRQVARPSEMVERHHQTLDVAPDATAGLNVFRRGFGLAVDNHQAEAGNVHAHRDHVGGKHRILGLGGVWIGRVSAEDLLEPGLVRIYEEWESREALAAHGRSAHIAAWHKALSAVTVIERDLKLIEAGKAEPLG